MGRLVVEHEHARYMRELFASYARRLVNNQALNGLSMYTCAHIYLWSFFVFVYIWRFVCLLVLCIIVLSVSIIVF